MMDIVIRGGKTVVPSGVGNWDIAISGEKIVAVALPGTLPKDAKHIIDATGKIIVPGGIDPHTHSGWANPTAAAEGVSLELATVSDMTRAAVFGGTTTIVDFARSRPGFDLWKAIDERNKDFGGASYTDYSYHVGMWHPDGGPPIEIIEQTKEVINAGFPSIKVYMLNTTPGRPPQRTDMGHIAAIMEHAVANNGIVMVHVEDQDIVNYNYKKLKHEGHYTLEYMPVAHSNLSEDLASRNIIYLAKCLGGAIYLAHLSAKEAVQAVAEGRAEGVPVYGETIVNYLCFTEEVYKSAEGALYHTYPSLKSEADRQALWRGLLFGPLSTVATDETFLGRAGKMRGQTIANCSGGCESIEPRMGVVFSEGVVKRGMTLERFVEITSANAAKILGMYPQKGAIAPGSDADVVIIDPSIHKRLSLADLHGDDYSIFDGYEIHGWPVTTILRGKIIVDNGQLLGKPGDGKLIPRKIISEVVRRPMC